MGLNFKILVIWKALSTMASKVTISASGVKPGSFGSAGSKIAPPAASATVPQTATVVAHSAAHSAPPPAPHPAAASPAHPAASTTVTAAACKHGKNCHGCRICGKGKGGKGGGASLIAEQIAAQKAEAEAKVAEARARTLRAQADAADAEARLKSVQSTAVVASTPRAKSGATSGGGDFITREEFNEFRGQVTDGFSTVFKQNEQTHAVLAGFVTMMNGGGLPASVAPVSRQIGIGAQEVVEPARQQISCGQNAGWYQPVEGSGRFTTHSSQRPQSVDAYGGGGASADDSSRFLPYRETPTEFRGSSGGSTLVAARQLGVSNHLQNFEAAAERWDSKRNPNNGKILQTIRQTTSDDNMRCILLALVNGKTRSEIVKMYNEEVASLLSTGNTTFFQNFFGALSRCGLPSNFDVKVDSSKTKTGHCFCMTYQQLSQAPGNVDKLVRILRGE